MQKPRWVNEMRFFFDYTSEEGRIYDYVGSEFKSTPSAVQFAEEKSALLKNAISRDWVGWSIEVCSAEGAKLCSLLIDGADRAPKRAA